MHFRLLSIHASNFIIIDFAGGWQIDAWKEWNAFIQIYIYSYMLVHMHNAHCKYNGQSSELVVVRVKFTFKFTISIKLLQSYAQWLIWYMNSASVDAHRFLFAVVQFNCWNFHFYPISIPILVVALCAVCRFFLNLIRLLLLRFFKCFVANDEMRQIWCDSCALCNFHFPRISIIMLSTLIQFIHSFIHSANPSLVKCKLHKNQPAWKDVRNAKNTTQAKKKDKNKNELEINETDRIFVDYIPAFSCRESDWCICSSGQAIWGVRGEKRLAFKSI